MPQDTKEIHRVDLDAVRLGSEKEKLAYVVPMHDEIISLREALAFVRKYADKTHDYWDAGDDSKVGKRLLALAGRLKGYNHDLDEALGVVLPDLA
jgi:hypothetical protein